METSDGAISALDPLSSDPNRIGVKVDGRRRATLPRTDVESLGLEVGRPWTLQLQSQVEERITLNKARRTALTLLSRRSFSVKELHERLLKREFTDAVAAVVIAEMRNDGWLDDAAHAEMLAREWIERRHAAPASIRRKLRERGIGEEDAEQAIRRVEETHEPRDVALAFARRNLGRMSGVEDDVALRRLSAALLRRGYDEEVIASVLKELGFSLEPPS